MTIPSQDLMKKCKRCEIVKEVIEFPISKTKKDGTPTRRQICRDCYNAYYVEYGIKNREKRNAYHRKWRAKQGNKYRKQQRERWHERLNSMTKNERKEFNKKMALKTRQRNAEMKDLVYNAYGGYKCACCGETEPSFLTIDHVNNDGAEHRRALKLKPGGTIIHRWLIKNNFPDGFQVLCWNCQWGKVKNNGICPHQIRCNDYPEGE